MRKLISSIVLLVAFLSVLGLIVLIAYPFIAVHSKGTDVAFQSSDGNWADSEDLLKGRDFDSIIFYFELYKILCNAPAAQLQRITNKPSIFSISRWFDDFNSPKWNVPLAAQHPNLKGEYYYPPVSSENCNNKERKQGEYELAEQHAAEYITSLSKTHNNAF